MTFPTWPAEKKTPEREGGHTGVVIRAFPRRRRGRGPHPRPDRQPAGEPRYRYFGPRPLRRAETGIFNPVHARLDAVHARRDEDHRRHVERDQKQDVPMTSFFNGGSA